VRDALGGSEKWAWRRRPSTQRADTARLAFRTHPPDMKRTPPASVDLFSRDPIREPFGRRAKHDLAVKSEDVELYGNVCARREPVFE